LTGKDEALRRALEADGALLEATRLRYRALQHILGAWRWRSRLRRNGELVREVIRVQPEVDRVLARAQRRAQAEGWPPGTVTRLLVDVARLEGTLVDLLQRRGEQEDVGLAAGLGYLELGVLRHVHGRTVPPRRRVAAREILPRTLPSLEAACRAAAALELLAKRPTVALDATTAPAFARALRAAEAGLQETWSRVASVDTSGAVTRFLERRARRVPLKAPRDGPDELIRAAFWVRMARARVSQALSVQLPGLALHEAELPTALEWLAGTAALPAAWPPSRRASFELARRLGRAQASRAACARWPSTEWDELLDAARLAVDEPRAAALQTALSELVRAWTQQPLPVIRLPALVEALREAAGP
jgi:hypothetical protein